MTAQGKRQPDEICSLLAIAAYATVEAGVGLQVYEGAAWGSCVGRRVEGRKDESVDSQRPKASQSPVEDDAGRVEQPAEGALPRSSTFYNGRRHVYRACCRNVGVGLALSEMLRRRMAVSGE